MIWFIGRAQDGAPTTVPLDLHHLMSQKGP